MRGQLPELPRQAVDFGELLTNGDLWLIGLVFLFYAPLEASLSVWATTYLTDLGQESGGAAWGLSAFWGAFLASRLLAAVLLHAAAASYLDVWMLIVAGGLGGGRPRQPDRDGQQDGGAVSLVLLGFVLGPVFPSLVGLLFRIEPKPPTGTAYGLVFALGSVGSLVLAPLVGAQGAADQRSGRRCTFRCCWRWRWPPSPWSSW